MAKDENKYVNTAKKVYGCMATAVAECNEYGWDDQFCRQRMRRSQESAMGLLKNEIDWENLSNEDCDALWFGTWDEETNLRLIPIYLRPIVPPEMEFVSIDGKKVKGKDFDNDHRYGYLAYGVIPKKPTN